MADLKHHAECLVKLIDLNAPDLIIANEVCILFRRVWEERPDLLEDMLKRRGLRLTERKNESWLLSVVNGSK